MRYIKFSLVSVFTILSISCSQFTGASEHAIALDNAIETMNNAVEPCKAERKSTVPPDLEDLKAMSAFSDKTMHHYINYRYHVNDEICLMQNGAVSKDYLTILAFNKDVDSSTRKKSKEWLKSLVTTSLLDDMDYINSLPEIERKALREINYLNSIFDPVITTRALRKYKEDISN